jgi:hypothetical protein
VTDPSVPVANPFDSDAQRADVTGWIVSGGKTVQMPWAMLHDDRLSVSAVKFLKVTPTLRAASAASAPAGFNGAPVDACAALLNPTLSIATAATTTTANRRKFFARVMVFPLDVRCAVHWTA